MKPTRIAAWTIALLLHSCLVIYATLPVRLSPPRVEPPAARTDVLIVSIIHHNPTLAQDPKPPATAPSVVRHVEAPRVPAPTPATPVQPRAVRVAARPQDLVSAPLKRPDVPPREIASYRVTDMPQYPLSAYDEGAEGWVVLIVLVGPDGHPEGISVSRSVSPQIDEAAIAAVSRWKFEPGLLRGRAVPSWISVPIGFFRGRLSRGSVESRDS
ncbi:energy transducer TonB [Rhodanobacter denitrificans]|uniref:energy transducer TonB n=1 Tax=Rhodanobacter denitrificans TaxID=666685 RepID=UPI001F24701F|nr:energy transducer TonB [Rhodanobacter denitrificans]UJJ60649.1 energy transducer TonB [Rhodanobacter denitrificans]